MISIDTNILLPAVESGNHDHEKAAAFLESLHDRDDVVISEFVLLELYALLLNSAVLREPLSPVAAVDVCESFRQHPNWQIVGFPPDSRIFTTRSGPACDRRISPAGVPLTGEQR